MKLWYTLLTLLLLTPSLHAQEQDSIPPFQQVVGVVDTIIISGNHKTDAYVILDEMSLKPGSEVTQEAIEFDRSRIYSLGLFNKVDISYVDLEGLRLLYVEVSERWYIIPVPLFGFRDGNTKRPYYGAGLLHNNVAGHNKKLFASAIFGYNPAFSLFYSDPLIDREHNLYGSGSISYFFIKNRSLIEKAMTGNFDERHFDVNATLGKRFTLYETFGITAGFHIVKVTDYREGRTLSPTGQDNYIYSVLNYTFDSRNLREYATSGAFVNFNITKTGFGESDVNFARVSADLRRYFPLPLELTLAGRLHGSMALGGTLPAYSRVYFGYGERLRGYYRTVFEGEHMAGSSLELRYPLLTARTIRITKVPLPEEFSVWRFGISLALFGDTGITWFRGEHPSLSALHSGYGAGVHFLLPYSYVMRTEYAYDTYFKGQFIFDLSTSF